MRRLPYVGIVRVLLTIWLLVLVYQGSRVALVILLALMCAANELTATVVKRLNS